MTLTLPMHSKVWSTPQPVISMSTCWMGLSWSFGFTQSVAPNCRASGNLSGLVSMAPGLGLPCTLDDSQADTAQPEDGHRVTGLHLGGVVHGADAGGDAAAEQTDVFGVGLRIDLGQRDLGHHGVFAEGGAAHVVVEPLYEKRVVPSGITPLPWVARTEVQRLVLLLLQNRHSPHSAV